MSPRRLLHEGVVLASGYVVERDVERRLLALSGRAELRALEGRSVALLHAPEEASVARAPGAPLVRHPARDLLLAGPCDEAALDRLGAPRGAVVLPIGGALAALVPGAALDPSALLELSSLALADVAPLGPPPPPPALAAPLATGDVRQALGAPPAAPGLARALEALRRGGREEPAPPRPSWLARAVGRLLGWLGGAASRGARPQPAGRPAVALARPEAPTWLDRVAARLRELSARLLPRESARKRDAYVEELFAMLDGEDWDGALRRAIPLAGEASDEGRPALVPPSPRAGLAFTGGLRGGEPSLVFPDGLYESLQQRYRRAHERLDREGRHLEAAFVLVELLGQAEEAVRYLERRGHAREAAELAELRELPPPVRVRQWLLAGDAARAVRLARRHDCFGAAIARLEAERDARLAGALRLLHGDLLAERGAYAAAVEAVWPVVEGRRVAGAWVDRAIELGGPAGAKMLVHKLNADPAAFPAVREVAAGWLSDPAATEERAALAAALAGLPAAPGRTAGPALGALARLTARALLARSEPTEQLERLVSIAGDELFLADLRAASDERPKRDLHVEGLVFEDRRGGAEVGAVLFGSSSPGPAVLAVFDAAGCPRDLQGRLGAALVRTRADGGPFDLPRALAAAGADVHAENLRSRGSGGFSAAGVAFDGRALTVAHVGDARVYRLAEGAATRLTKDHTLAERGAPEALRSVDATSAGRILLSALGLQPDLEADRDVLTAARGDRLLVCTAAVADALERAGALDTLGAGPLAAAWARFTGLVLPAGGAAGLLEVTGSSLPSPAAAASIPASPARGGPPVHARPAHDVGGLAVLDAVLAPRGHLLLALGEGGVRLVDAAGRALASFPVPADRLVSSDAGERVLALARRGTAWQLSRVDLRTRRAEPWCEARLDAFAPTFDGATWFVAERGRLQAIDALDTRWSSLWRFDDAPGCTALARDAQDLWALGETLLHFSLPDLSLRRRGPLPEGVGSLLLTPEGQLQGLEGGRVWAAEVAASARPACRALLGGARGVVAFERPDGSVALADARRGTVAELRLEGVGRVSARPASRERWLVFDDRGRVLAVDARTGALSGEWRVI